MEKQENLSNQELLQEKVPNGPLSAAILASGIGSMAYGFFVTLTEGSTAIKHLLTFSHAVGPLSGKTMLGVMVWFIAWIILHITWKNREVNFGKVFKVTMILITLGFVGTFPPFYEMFTH